ncbi:PepSY-associated TM helix domain-containing protein [Caulobacter mirabilis]|uniref:Peptidase n=1 Tax=Caulobacter mirabilis TaxID=69666 RepID=A0A2D2AYU5_9CAUL|nr:peptidase [Caulobacter mirabilis]
MSKSIWPKIPSGFVRAVLAGHSSLGLAFAALIYLVCFSGSIAVLANEFKRWEQPDAPQLTRVEPAAIQRAVEQAVARHKGAEHIYLYPPTPDLPRFTLYVDVPKITHDPEYVADGQGTLVSDAQHAWTEFMTSMHIYLHLPQTWGMFVVGLTGVALLSSLISGVLAHPRVFKDAFHLRWGGSKRLQEADLHNRIGVWALPFHIAISLTGALLGLTIVIVGILALAVFKGDTDKAYALFIPPHPVDDPRPAALPDIPAAIKVIQAKAPGYAPVLVVLEHPGEEGGAILINAAKPGTLSRGDTYTFDRHGKLMYSKRFEEMNLGEKIIQVLAPIHFGWFAGGLMKTVYVVLGLGLTAVTSSGVAIWLARRRAKGRPAPRWERVWIATVWSQPFSFAVAAVVSLLAPLPMLAVWAAATAVALALAAAWTPQQLSARLRLATAGFMVGAAVLHMILKGGVMADPMGWIMDAIILASAAVLAATVLRLKPRETVAEPQPVPAE